ncbi:MAG: hypothetical protein IJT94_05450 [Oscillibacter sp.]|nr:hypothetical protein [Oscillibacter sp.]
MALPRFQFSGSWENPADFPTHEYSEVQVRKDLMRYFTEIETFLNKTLLPLLESGGYGSGAAGGSGTIGGSGTGGGGAYLPLAGGQMSGPLLLAQNPAYPTEAATKQYVDDAGGLIQQGINDAIAAITVELGRIQAIAADGSGNVSQLTMTPDQVEAIVQNALGGVASAALSAEQIQAMLRNALGDTAQLTMTPEEINAFVMDKIGNISKLIISADDMQALIQDIAGNAASLTMTPEELQALVQDNLENFSQILQTSEEIRQKVQDELGSSSQVNLTAEEIQALVSNVLGSTAQVSMTADEVRAIVRSEFNTEAMLEVLSNKIQLLVSEAAKQAGVNITADDVAVMVRDALSTADFSVLSDAIAGRVADSENNIAALQVTAAGLASRVDSAEGSLSLLQQTAEGLASAVASQSGDISRLEQTAQGIQTAVESQSGDLSQLQQTASTIQTTVSGQTGELSVLRQTADGLTAATAALNGRASSIEQKLDSISFSVSNETNGTEVFARIVLRVGQDSYTGRIRLEGNVDVSGELSAQALYAQRGDVADLAVDQLTTSRRIVKYLAGDTTDDNFIRLHDQYLEFVTGEYQAGDTVQAMSPDGLPLYWEADVSGASRGADGYPVAEGERIFTTTLPTAAQQNWPVYTYRYTEAVKRSIRFEQQSNGVYAPVDTYGAGNAQGYNKAAVWKGTDGFDLQYVTPSGRTVGIRMTTDGYVDITGLRRTTALNFSGWDSGSFSEAVEGGQLIGYTVSFDAEGRPVAIADASTGFVTTITW